MSIWPSAKKNEPDAPVARLLRVSEGPVPDGAPERTGVPGSEAAEPASGQAGQEASEQPRSAAMSIGPVPQPASPPERPGGAAMQSTTEETTEGAEASAGFELTPVSDGGEGRVGIEGAEGDSPADDAPPSEETALPWLSPWAEGTSAAPTGAESEQTEMEATTAPASPWPANVVDLPPAPPAPSVAAAVKGPRADWDETEAIARLIVGLGDFRALLVQAPDAELAAAVRAAAARELTGIGQSLAALMAGDSRAAMGSSSAAVRLGWLIDALEDPEGAPGRFSSVRPVLDQVRSRTLRD